MFNSIVAAIDGSQSAHRATDLAAGLAKAHGAKLVLVHIAGHGPVPTALAHMAEVEHLVEPAHPGPGALANVVGGLASAHRGSDSVEFADQVRIAVGQKLLNESRVRARDLGARTIELEIVADGSAAEGIIAATERHAADLVVMGARGLSDLRGLLLGSVSHKVCQLAKCPCLTVK